MSENKKMSTISKTRDETRSLTASKCNTRHDRGSKRKVATEVAGESVL